MIDPARTGRNPMTERRVVVLPTPSRPIRQTTSPAATLRVTPRRFREEFQRDESVKASVFSLIDNSHASAAELLDNAVMRDNFADHFGPRLQPASLAPVG